MRELFLENSLSRSIRSILEEKTYTFKNLQVLSVEVRRFHRPIGVSVTAYGSDQTVTPLQVKLVHDLLVRETGIPIDFRLRIVPATEIGALEVTPSGQSLTPVEHALSPTDSSLSTPVSSPAEVTETKSVQTGPSADSAPSQPQTGSETQNSAPIDLPATDSAVDQSSGSSDR